MEGLSLSSDGDFRVNPISSVHHFSTLDMSVLGRQVLRKGCCNEDSWHFPKNPCDSPSNCSSGSFGIPIATRHSRHSLNGLNLWMKWSLCLGLNRSQRGDKVWTISECQRTAQVVGALRLGISNAKKIPQRVTLLA